MKTKNVEVECRGPLSRAQFLSLKNILSRKGKLVAVKKRLLIDYSTFLKGQGLRKRDRDIRLRVTNRVPEIIVKLGAWGGAEQREELSIKTAPGTFDTLVKIFGALGFERGILAVRRITAYMYRGVEFSLVEVPGHSYFFEAELMVSDKHNTKDAHIKLKNACEDLGLEIYDSRGFFLYVLKLNREANTIFDFKNYRDNYFKNRFHL
jgi:adenylate cyclase class IV